ncbi:MAG: hypothetical protein V3V92_01225 [Candidatus Hydrothermarchaeales archaeon]
MSGGKWSKEEVIELPGQKEEIAKKLVNALANDDDNIFAAEFGFGSPQIDLAAVTKLRVIEGYLVNFPVVDGEISALPYFQGLGEALFLYDQAVNEPYLLVPDYDIEEEIAFTFEGNVIKRMKKRVVDIGLAVFDNEYNVRKLKTPMPRPRKYVRLELELIESILKYGKTKIAPGKEAEYEEYTEWLDLEFKEMNKRLVGAEDAEQLSQKYLRDKGFYSVKMSFQKAEVESAPRAIPVFNVEGEGVRLGEDEKFSFTINRISGKLSWNS